MDSSRDGPEFAVAASAIRQTTPVDFNLESRSEIGQLARGGGSGRVERPLGGTGPFLGFDRGPGGSGFSEPPIYCWRS